MSRPSDGKLGITIPFCLHCKRKRTANSKGICTKCMDEVHKSLLISSITKQVQVKRKGCTPP